MTLQKPVTIIQEYRTVYSVVMICFPGEVGYRRSDVRPSRTPAVYDHPLFPLSPFCGVIYLYLYKHHLLALNNGPENFSDMNACA